MAAKKRAMYPMRPTAETAPCPIRRTTCVISNCVTLRTGEELLPIIGRRIMKWHRTIGLAIDKLAHERFARGAHLRRGALRHDAPFGDEIKVIDDLQRLVHVVRHDDRGDAERIVQLAD